MNKASYQLQDTDEVERIRQVRRDIEKECKTLSGLFEWIEQLDRERGKRNRARRAAASKAAKGGAGLGGRNTSKRRK